jgi:hypothetical protein
MTTEIRGTPQGLFMAVSVPESIQRGVKNALEPAEAHGRMGGTALKVAIPDKRHS